MLLVQKEPFGLFHTFAMLMHYPSFQIILMPKVEFMPYIARSEIRSSTQW